MTRHAAQKGAAHVTRWLHQARAGDAEAFRKLCGPESRERWLVAIAWSLPRRLRRKVDPEDILQETLAQAWRDRGSLEDVSSRGFHRWVLGISRHRVADTVRYYDQDKRRRGQEESHPSADSSAYRSDRTPSKSAARRDQAVKIAEILDGLKDSYREAIRLRFLEGYSPKEMVDMLGKTRENIDTTVHRALKRLGELLKEQAIDSTIFRPL